MIYTNDDRMNIGNLYAEVHKKRLNNEKIIKEEYFADVEDEAEALDGDLDGAIVGGGPDEDNDLLNDGLEEKVYSYLNRELGENFRRQCDELKEKFDLTEDEFIQFFKGWFDEQHVASHLSGDLGDI